MWPPVGAVAVDVAGAYDDLVGRGYGYGPAFQGLRAVWRRGDEIFAEVDLPQHAGVTTGGFGIHPVLLDAALHALGVADERIETVLPFSWQGVSLHAAGASRVRVRLAPVGTGAVSVELADSSGLPVLSVRELVTRRRLGRAVDCGGVGPVRKRRAAGDGVVAGLAGGQRHWRELSRYGIHALMVQAWSRRRTRPLTRPWASYSPG